MGRIILSNLQGGGGDVCVGGGGVLSFENSNFESKIRSVNSVSDGKKMHDFDIICPKKWDATPSFIP